MEDDLRHEHLDRLSRINDALQDMGMRPLAGVGRNDLGQIALLAIERVEREGRGPKCEVIFRARTPEGRDRPYAITCNTNGAVSDGGTIVPVVNNQHIAVITQWRPEIGQYSTELPRGAGERGDSPPTLGPIGAPRHPDRPPSLQTALREFKEEVTAQCQVLATRYLGWACENTGGCNVAPDNWLLHIAMSDEAMVALRNRAVRPITFLTIAQAYGYPPPTPDQHSITALHLARPYFQELRIL